MGDNLKKRIIFSILLGFATAFTGIFFQNCGSNEFAFSTITSSASVKRQEVDLGGGVVQVTDKFVVRAEKQSMIDMVWVVDNSGSMSQEAAHVRNNVLAFATAAEKEARLKMALISLISNKGYGTYLPDSLKAAGGLEINATVSSHNALVMLGAALCVDPNMPFCAEYKVSNAQGKLNGFFRDGAKKLFVIVTDDESQISSSTFLQFLNDKYPNERARIFGFVGLGAGVSPCQAKTGQQYVNLSSESAGAVYNICSEDWTSHFSELTQAVSVIANYEYELKVSQIKEIISVKINGAVLSPAAYTIQNGVLSLNPTTSMSLAGGELEIVYTYSI